MYGPIVEPSGTIVSFSRDTLEGFKVSNNERKDIFNSQSVLHNDDYQHLDVVRPAMDNQMGVLSGKAGILRHTDVKKRVQKLV